jgi:hypothetical protein
MEDQLLLFFSDPSQPSRDSLFFLPVEFQQRIGYSQMAHGTYTKNGINLKLPKARIKIGGFNERWNSIANKTLSDLRAASVAAAKSAGANANQFVGVEVLVPTLQNILLMQLIL